MRMRSNAARWLTDRVSFATQTTTTATRANMAAGTLTTGTASTYRALVRQPSVSQQDTPTADRVVRELSIWVDDAATVTAGMLATIIDCADSTLEGATGTVLLVERDSIRPIRRVTVRMANDE